MAEATSDFAAWVFAGTETLPPSYPMAHYDADGDTYECFLCSGTYYGKWVDHHLTVYLDHETGGIVGYCVDGASRLCPRASFWSVYGLGAAGALVWAAVLALAVYQFLGP